MKSLPKKYLLPIKPKQYLKQGPSHCGAYSVKGILSAIGLDSKNHPGEYHPNWLGRITGLTLGRNYYVKILSVNGVESEVDSAQDLPAPQKLIILKSLLAKDTPVMIRIGNGFIGSNKYNPIFGKILGHWITLWGFDDAKAVFYVYDSALPRRYWEKDLSVGNTRRTYNEILRDWNFGRWQFWLWPFCGRDRNLYIHLLKKGDRK